MGLKRLTDIQKKDREDYTKALFDSMWSGKRVWDALLNMEEERHIPPSKAVNCISRRGCWDEIKYEMDWKQTGFKVVLEGTVRPTFGIWEFFFGNAEDKCFHKAVKWLDDACDEEQVFLFTVTFLAKGTPITGGERNKKLAEKFIKYLDSIEPEVSLIDANLKADKVLQED